MVRIFVKLSSLGVTHREPTVIHQLLDFLAGTFEVVFLTSGTRLLVSSSLNKPVALLPTLRLRELVDILFHHSFLETRSTSNINRPLVGLSTELSLVSVQVGGHTTSVQVGAFFQEIAVLFDWPATTFLQMKKRQFLSWLVVLALSPAAVVHVSPPVDTLLLPPERNHVCLVFRFRIFDFVVFN